MKNRAVDEVRVSVTLDPYLSLKALAGFSGLCVRTLRELLTRPFAPLPSYRVGGKILVKRSEFDAWMGQFRQRDALDLDSIAASAIREIRAEANGQSGGHASQPRAASGSARTPRTPGVGGVQTRPSGDGL